jgi:hypothetical protein
MELYWEYEREASSVTQDTTPKLVISYWKYGSEAPSENLRVVPVVNQWNGVILEIFISRQRQKMSWLIKDENDVDVQYSSN